MKMRVFAEPVLIALVCAGAIPSASALPDLVVVAVDSSALVSDCTTADISGSLMATVRNLGDQDVTRTCRVTFFADNDGDGAWSLQADRLIGEMDLQPLGIGDTAIVSSAVHGTLPFAGAFVHMAVDSRQVIDESDESNNVGHSGWGSRNQPPTGIGQPQERFVVATDYDVETTPIVVHLDDDNSDGRIGQGDVPAIIFPATETHPGRVNNPGRIVAYRGDADDHPTDTRLWISPAEWPVRSAGNIAVGDLDGDGFPEVVAVNYAKNRILAFNGSDGSFRWQSEPALLLSSDSICPNLAIANLTGNAVTGDDRPHIIAGACVYSADGALLGDGRVLLGSVGYNGRFVASIVADLDADGQPELIAGGTAYNLGPSGLSIKFQRPGLEGFTAVANLDPSTPNPEIVVVGNGYIRMLAFDFSDAAAWNPPTHSPILMTQSSGPNTPVGGGPAIADLDGDGDPDIAVSGVAKVQAFRADGTELWPGVTINDQSSSCSLSAFDFDGDGAYELLSRDQVNLRIISGQTGEVLWSQYMPSGTATEVGALVADTNGDGRAEIVTSAVGAATPPGVHVLEDALDNWCGARPSWNQNSYHLTNVGDDGSIPRHEKNNWSYPPAEPYNNFRTQLAGPGGPFIVPNLTASLLHATGDVCSEDVTLTVRIGNGGGVSTGSAPIVQFYDHEPSAGNPIGAPVTLSARLQPGAWEDVSITYTQTAGPQEIWVVVDPDTGSSGYGLVREGREDDNSCSLHYVRNCSANQPPREALLTITGALSGHYHDAVEVAALLIDQETAAPVPYALVDFDLSGAPPSTCIALTDTTGRAACWLTATGDDVTNATLSADSHASSRYEAVHSDLPFDIGLEETSLWVDSPNVLPWSLSPFVVSATLREDGGLALDAKTIAFSLDSASPPHTASTIATGRATWAMSTPPLPGTHSLDVSYDESTYHHEATATQQLVVVAPQVALYPLAGIATLDLPYAIVARVLDDGGLLENRTIHFEFASGVNSGGAPGSCGTCLTDPATHEVTWTYTPVNEGRDVILACVDVNGNDDCDSFEPSTTSIVDTTVTHATRLTWQGVSVGITHDPAEIAAKLEASVSGTWTAVEGVAVALTLGSRTCLADTDASGVATCWITPGCSEVQRSASFAGGSGPSTGSPSYAAWSLDPVDFTVSKEQPTLRMLSAPVQQLGNVWVKAVLREDDAAGISYKLITFSGGGAPPVSGTTDSQGVVLVQMALTATASVTATFATDACYLGHASTQEIMVVPWDPGVTLDPSGPPAPPVDVGVERLTDGSVRVYWSEAPPCGLCLGTLAITGYFVTVNDGINDPINYPCPGHCTERIITELPNGSDALSFTVTTADERKIGPASSAVTMVPWAVPSAPRELTAVAEPEQVALSWLAPLAPGGAPDLHYEIVVQPGGAILDAGTNLQHDVTSLTNGAAYTFRVRAVTDAGLGVESVLAGPVIPRDKTSAPQDVVATPAGSGSAMVYWRMPDELNGAQVQLWQVKVNGTTEQAEFANFSNVAVLVSDLENGTLCTFQVRANNSALPDDWSAWSDASVLPVVPADVPAAPTVSPERLNGAVRLTWSLPDNGGSAITGYAAVAAADPNTGALPTGTPSTIVTDLANGTLASLEVTAANLVGQSSAGSADGTPARQPDGPTWGSAPVFGDTIAALTWATPAFNGGEAITDYVITTDPPSEETPVSGVSTTSWTIDDLVNGQEYVAYIQAVNGIDPDGGRGEYSWASPPFRPGREPDPPRNVTAVVVGDRSVRVTWLAPATDGGRPIDAYDITSDEPASLPASLSPYARTIVLNGLTAGLTYTFSLTAHNELGSSAAEDSNPVLVPTIPQAPPSTLATASSGAVSLAWDWDENDEEANGWAELLSFLICPIPGDVPCHEVGPDNRFGEATDLQNGREYRFEIHARNTVGLGPAAITDPVTPCTTPMIPLNVMATVSGDGELAVSWHAPAWDGGCDILSYNVTQVDGPPHPNATNPETFDGLTPGDEYTFQVVAHNSAGDSPPAVGSGRAATCPSAPEPNFDVDTGAGEDWEVSLYGGGEMVRACWDAPLEDGYSAITKYVVVAYLDSDPPPTGTPVATVETPDGHTTCADVGGLTNGIDYRFTVHAVNAACDGPKWTTTHPIAPAELQIVTFTIAPSPVTGGNIAWGTVTLDGMPAGVGAVVGLDTNPGGGDPAVAFAETVIVPSGRLSVTFPITTRRVTDAVTLRATLGTSTADSSLDIVEPLPCGSVVTASIHSPLDGVEIWDHEQEENQIRISVDCATSWTLKYKLDPSAHPDSELPWTELANDSSDGLTVVDQVVATLDPTMELNGVYEIWLHAEDGVNDDVDVMTHVLIKGNQKLSNFSLAYVDMKVPVAGVPFEIVRTYDSRDHRKGDFGIGWHMSLRNVRVEVAHRPGHGWSQVNEQYALMWPNICVKPDMPHSVMISLSGNTSFHFEPGFRRQEHSPGSTCGISEPNVGWLAYDCVSRPSARLTPYRGSQALGPVQFVSGSGVFLDTALPGFEEFEPDAFVLELRNGTKYTIRRYGSSPAYTWKLTHIVDLKGNEITIDDDGITATPSGIGVTFVRSGEFIERIVDSKGAHATYMQDVDDHLVQFQDRQMRANCDMFTLTETPPLPDICTPKFVRYEYTEVDYPHFLTGVFDPEHATRQVVENHYDSEGRLFETCDALGHCVETPPPNFVGTRTQDITDRRGFMTRLEFDGHGNVLFKTLPLPGSPVLGFLYNAFDQVTAEMYPDNVGNMSYEYDDDEVTKITDGFAKETLLDYTGHGQLKSTTLPDGQEWTSTYDDLQGVLLGSTDALGNVTTYVPNLDSKETKFTIDPEGGITETNIVNGLLRDETDANGVFTRYFHDLMGNVSKVDRYLDIGVHVTEYVRDANDEIIQVISPDETTTSTVCDANGLKTSTFDEKGRETTYEYDELNQIVLVTFPDDTTEEFAYDDSGNRIWTKGRDGRCTRQEHDELDRVKWSWREACTTAPASGPPMSGPPSEPYTETQYDVVGRVKKRIDERGNTTCYLYDIAGRQTEVWPPDKDDPDGEDADCDPILATVTAYDDNGWVKWVRDSRGLYSAYLYDDNGRKLRDCRLDSEPTGPGDLTDEVCKKYEYDKLGRITSEEDEDGKVTSFTHDPVGRLSSVTDALNHAWTYGYDDLGNKTSQTDPLNRTTSWVYDVMGRKVSRTLPLGQTESFSYYDWGPMETHVSFNGDVTTYEFYEATDQVQEIVFDEDADNEPPVTFVYENAGGQSGQRAAVTIGSENPTTYDYAPVEGWLTEVTHPNGWTLQYGHDVAGKVTSVTTTSTGSPHVTTTTYDSHGRPKKVGDAAMPGDHDVEYVYDAAGNLDAIEYPVVSGDAMVADYGTPDNWNRTTGMQWKLGSTLLAKYDYTTTNAGVRTHLWELGGRSTEFQHDGVNRLTSEMITSPSETRLIEFTYDAVGNRVARDVTVDSLPVELIEYHVDDNDRLEWQHDAVTNATTVYAWDPNGNQTDAIDSINSTSYTWDTQCRLIRAETSSGTLEFLYDADGIRKSTTENAATTDYLVDSNRTYAQAMEEHGPSSGEVRRWVFGHRRLAQDDADGTRWLVTDSLGSVRELRTIDALGTPTESYRYEAFGTPLDHQDEAGFRFTGEPWQPELGMLYLRARWMETARGGFVGADPAPGNQARPGSLLRYSYAENSPLWLTDPSGREGVLEATVVATTTFMGGISPTVLIGHSAPSAQSPSVGPLELIPITTASQGWADWAIQRELRSAKTFWAQHGINVVIGQPLDPIDLGPTANLDILDETHEDKVNAVLQPLSPWPLNQVPVFFVGTSALSNEPGFTWPDTLDPHTNALIVISHFVKETTLAHEIGHTLTLPHVWPPSRLMWKYYHGSGVTAEEVQQAKNGMRQRLGQAP